MSNAMAPVAAAKPAKRKLSFKEQRELDAIPKCIEALEKEQAELKVLEAYLPQQMTKEQIEVVVSQVIAALQAKTIKDMGTVMKEVLAKTAGAADNKTISEVIKAKLS